MLLVKMIINTIGSLSMYYKMKITEVCMNILLYLSMPFIYQYHKYRVFPMGFER